MAAAACTLLATVHASGGFKLGAVSIDDQKNIKNNHISAKAHHPETLGRAGMLYVPVTIKGHSIAAFVDCGAQSTLMSPELAIKLGLSRLIDTRVTGVTLGIGSSPAKVLGRIYSAPMIIGDSEVELTFTILEFGLGFSSTALMLGLDALKRLKTVIDLKENVLRIGRGVVNFLTDEERRGLENSARPLAPSGFHSPSPTRHSKTTVATATPWEIYAQTLADVFKIDVEKALNTLNQTGGDVGKAMTILIGSL